MRQTSIALPLFFIVAGAIWFLKATDILPSTATIVAVALILFGLLVPILDGINNQTVVTSPMLIYIGVAVYLRNEYLVNYSPLIALGMMLFGCLLLLAQSKLIPQKPRNPNITS